MTFIDLEEACRAVCQECRHKILFVKGFPHRHVYRDGGDSRCEAAPLRRLRRWGPTLKPFDNERRALDESTVRYHENDGTLFVIGPIPAEGGEDAR